MRPSSKSDSQERKRSFHLLDRLMKPILPRPVRSIIERQHVVLSRCVFAIGLPDNGILPELDDRQISRFAYRSFVPHLTMKVTRRCPTWDTISDPTSGQLLEFRDTYSGIEQHERSQRWTKQKRNPQPPL